MSSAQLDLARHIRVGRQAEAEASAVTAAFRQARGKQGLRQRLTRAAARAHLA